MVGMLRYRSVSRRVFEVFLYLGFILLCLCIVLPFMHVAAVSLSSKSAILKNQVTIFPVELYTRAYDIILSSRLFFTSLTNTVLLTMVNTLVAIVIAVSAAYALANKHFRGMRTALVYTLIPLYLSGGLIPFYLIVNSYGLNNTRLALMLPYLVDPFLIIVFRNAIVRLPQEIMESAEVDGASEFTILFRIVFRPDHSHGGPPSPSFQRCSTGTCGSPCSSSFATSGSGRSSTCSATSIPIR